MDTLQHSPNDNADGKLVRRRWLRRGLWFVLLSCAGLFWLDGPGVRWLVPKIAAHYFEKAGLCGGFRLEGNLTGDLSLHDFWLEGDKLAGRIAIKRIIPDYRIMEVFSGRLRGIGADGIQIDLDLARRPKHAGADKPAVDLEKIVAAMRGARERFIPLEMDLRGITLSASDGEGAVVRLADSRIRHRAGEELLSFEIGDITDAAGRVWPAREVAARWNQQDISIGRMDLFAGASVVDLVLGLPASGKPSLDAEIHVDDAVFVIAGSPGLASLQLDLREGRVAVERLSGWLDPAGRISAGGFLTSLSLGLDGLLPDPRNMTGGLRVLLEDLKRGEWSVPELSVDMGLDAAQASLSASGQALGTEFVIHAVAPLDRAGPGLVADAVTGDFHVAGVPGVVEALAGRIPAIHPDVRIPAAVLDGGFRISLKRMVPSGVDVSAVLKPDAAEAAATLFLGGQWGADRIIRASLESEGLKAEGSYDAGSSIYRIEALARGLASPRVMPWLAAFGVRFGDVLTLDGKWNGSGVLRQSRHEGVVSLAHGEWRRAGGMPPVEAGGEIDYDWPGGFSINGLRLKTSGQTLDAGARLADGMLELSELEWRDGDVALATGRARLPVPRDFSGWRETLADDKRPLMVDIQSSVLPLDRLKSWLPAAGKLDPRSTGHLGVKVGGSFALPEMDVSLDVKGLRAPEQPRLPPVDVLLQISGRDGRLKVDGKATSPDLPSALVSASMPFRPADWAENPDRLGAEEIDARLDLPRVELSRFASLVPAARRMAGSLTGNIVATGELGSPEVLGKVVMTGGMIEMENENVPVVKGIQGELSLTRERVTLGRLSADIAGGGLKASGTLDLDGGKPGAIDFRLTGSHVPLVRNDSMIVRANADLRIGGTYQQAVVGGTIGLVNSLFYRDIELLPIGRPFTAPAAAALPKLDKLPSKPGAAVPEPFRDWKLDLRVHTADPFLVRGNLATGRIRGDVRVSGTIGDPLPDGDVRISNLTASLPFSTLTVKSGLLHFTHQTGFDPILEIRGTARPNPYTVNIYAYGPASDPQLVLTSNPPLPDNEIMTLLATGTTTSGLEDPQTASTRALQLVAEELRRGRFVFGRQLRPLLGLFDRVDLGLAESDPYSGDSFSSATIRLDDRWLLSAGMGAEGDTRVMVIWRLTFH